MANVLKTLITAKKETTYGTAATLTGSEAILVSNPQIRPMNARTVSRENVRPYFGNFQKLITGQNVECSFDVEAAGSGTAGTAPKFGDLLLACGMAATLMASVKATYKPVSAAFDAVTIGYNIDGIYHLVTGARGSVRLAFEAGGIPKLSFTFQGIYNAPTDTAAVVPVYTGFQTPRAVTIPNTPTLSLHAVSSPTQSVSIDLANQLAFRSLPGGSEQVLITGRQPQGSMTIERGTIAAKAWEATVAAGTLGALSVIHGTVAGNIVEVAAAGVGLSQLSYGQSDNILEMTLGLEFQPSSGNDEIELIFR